jgi:hypothetical protein
VKLHTVHEEKPTKELVGREERLRKRKVRNITQKPLGGLGMRSVLGKMT